MGRLYDRSLPTNYLEMHPEEGENPVAYAVRLEAAGHEEMLIRKALRAHFGFEIAELPPLVAGCELAKLRHIDLLTEIAPNRTRYSLIRKVAKNLGVSEDEAADWVERYERAVGEES
ncbi:MAG: hypothetical protein AAF441_08360 [Pseudomonadota bacterium]